MTDEHSRRFVRVEHRIDIDYSVQGSAFRAPLTDLSEGGAFVDTTYPQEVGAELDFRFQLPDGSEPIAGRACVVWAQEMVGMGIHFIEMSDDELERIRFFVGSVYFGFDDNLPGGESA